MEIIRVNLNKAFKYLQNGPSKKETRKKVQILFINNSDLNLLLQLHFGHHTHSLQQTNSVIKLHDRLLIALLLLLRLFKYT